MHPEDRLRLRRLFLSIARRQNAEASVELRARHADGSWRSIEAVINTTPNDVHLETTRTAAAAGKHVFLDKPIANTVADGLAIAEVCKQAGVVLALGYQERREELLATLAELDEHFEAGELGAAAYQRARDVAVDVESV